MPREYTDVSLQDGKVALARDADDLNKVVDQVNGLLDGNQLPMESVGTSKLIHAAPSSTTRKGPCHRWYVEEASDWSEDTAIGSWAHDSADWYSNGWIPLSSQLTNGGDQLTVPALEGLCWGWVVVDCGKEHTIFRDTVLSATGSFGPNWWEIGLFANGVLVAQSGRFPGKGRRLTRAVPFNIPCGSESILFETKWRAAEYELETTNTTNNAYLWYHSPFEVFGAGIYVCNQVR